MPKIHYPTGVARPTRRGLKQPAMKNYTVKPIRKRMPWQKKHRSKYNAKKIHAFGHIFDSKVEFSYYCYLRFVLRVPFKMHQRFVILPHTEYRGKTDGKSHAIRQHSYTPDFCVYSDKGALKRVIDVKGMKSRGTSYDHLRFDLFSKRYHVPVYTVRKQHGQFLTEIWGK